MSGWLTYERRWVWKIALELKLRRVNGVAFQDFFSDVMERAHGDDFIRTRPYGQRGDKGCDGFLRSLGQVFACYGKLDDACPSVAALVEKMDDDYGKACKHLKAVLRGWYFVHNMLDGTPTEATVLKLGDLEVANPSHSFGVIGREGIEQRVFSLNEADIVSLIGPAVSAEDTRNMKLEIVAELVDAVIEAVEVSPLDGGALKPVPFGKLTFNGLPKHWCHTVVAAMPNIHHVRDYFRRHLDPERGARVAAIFNGRYLALKRQGLAPDSIMGNLYDDIVGIGSVTNDRVVAAQAVLAFLFDACDIFEDKPMEPTR